MTRVFAAAVLIGITGLGVSAQRGRGFPPPGPQAGPPDGVGRMIVPENNPLTPEKIAKGRELFFETGLSIDNSTSCASCHDPNKAFTDGKPVAIGIHETKGTRNTQTLVNAGSGRVFFWDGRANSLETQALQPMMNAKEMGLKESQIQERTGLSAADVRDALASYMRTIRSNDSRVDYYRQGQTGMLNADEKAGFDLFRGRGGCQQCHGGPNFTDDRFHNTGVGFRNGVHADAGRFEPVERRARSRRLQDADAPRSRVDRALHARRKRLDAR